MTTNHATNQVDETPEAFPHTASPSNRPREQACEAMLNSLRQCLVLTVVWIPNRRAIVQMRSNERFIEA